MIPRTLFILSNPEVRERAVNVIRHAEHKTRVDFRPPQRTLPQNSRMWAMLTDISVQLVHHGKRYEPNDWKKLFLDLLSREVRLAPALDGSGFVDLGRSSSELGIPEMSDLIEVMFAFGAEHNVVWSNEGRAAA